MALTPIDCDQRAKGEKSEEGGGGGGGYDGCTFPY